MSPINDVTAKITDATTHYSASSLGDDGRKQLTQLQLVQEFSQKAGVFKREDGDVCLTIPVQNNSCFDASNIHSQNEHSVRRMCMHPTDVDISVDIAPTNGRQNEARISLNHRTSSNTVASYNFILGTSGLCYNGIAINGSGQKQSTILQQPTPAQKEPKSVTQCKVPNVVHFEGQVTPELEQTCNNHKTVAKFNVVKKKPTGVTLNGKSVEIGLLHGTDTASAQEQNHIVLLTNNRM